MSHSNIESSGRRNDRFSWISLPTSDTENATLREISPSPVSRAQSQSPNYGHTGSSVPAVASPEPGGEMDGLLHPKPTEFRHSTVPPATDPAFVKSTSGALTTDEPVHFEVKDASTSAPCTWLPFSLRWPFLVTLASISLVAAIVLAVLSWYSAKNHGLDDDDGSMGLYFSWRYIPTIVAVLFTQALVIIAEDVKRTEAFARMARPVPTTATHTLFYIPRVWWKTVYKGYSQKRSGGHRSWILVFSSLAAGFSLLVISTFASSVFVAKEILSRNNVELQRYTPESNGTISLEPHRDMYFHTISGFLYNASSSIWVSDSYVILPIQTHAGGQSLHDGLWQAETKILQLESTCVPMTITEKVMRNISYSYDSHDICQNGPCIGKSKGFTVRTGDGCEIQMQSPIADVIGPFGYGGRLSADDYRADDLTLSGGMFWTNVSSSYISWSDLIREHGPVPPIDSSGQLVLDQWSHTFIYNASDACHGRDLLLVTPPWSSEIEEDSQASYWDNFTATAQLCTPKYYEATLPVTVTVAGSATQSSFDVSQFAQRRTSASSVLLDLGSLDDLSFRGSWNKYMTLSGQLSEIQGFDGLARLLATSFSLSVDNMLMNHTLSTEASRLRGRFFGELIISSVMEADVPVLETVGGQVTSTAQRILIVTQIAITLAVLLLLASTYLLAMAWNIKTARRPLLLRADPATIAGATSLVATTSSLVSELRALQSSKRSKAQSVLEVYTYALRDGNITSEADTRAVETAVPSAKALGKTPNLSKRNSLKKDRRDDWRPSLLHKKWLAVFLVVLVGIAIALLVLRKYAKEGRLYRSAFVYQVDLGRFNTSFSPHAIIASLVAVLIGLCWDGIDNPMRTLQPYLSMSRSASEARRGLRLSYQSSYWIWAAVQAALRRHWILCLITVGTTLSQILIISMAAIFERQTVIRAQTTQSLGVHLTRSLSPRIEPFSFGIGLATRPFYLDEALLRTTENDWAYNALDEVVLNTEAPPWTHDEWVFTPLNLLSLPNITLSQNTGPSSKSVEELYSTNVSVTTSALRSRLSCVNNRLPTRWLDRAEDIFPDRKNETITGYVLPATLFDDEPYRTPVFTVPRRMACCANGTGSGQSVIAYWSSNSEESMLEEQASVSNDDNAPEDLKEASGWSNNFTIKWIVGPAASTPISGANPEPNHVQSNIGYANETLLYFIEEPKTSILNCIPIIEQANASITVARSSGRVLTSTILEKPVPAPGAWDHPYDILYPDPTNNNSKGNVSYGVFFLSQLLTVPHIIPPAIYSSWLVYNRSVEDVSSERFSIRDTDKGLNMDFMSYSNYFLAKQDPTALLDPGTLLKQSEKTLQTFFRHFATTGRWSYGNSAKRTVYDEVYGLYRGEEVNGTLSERIEVLAMNEVATWLSLTIIFLLIAILVVLIVSLHVVYPSTSMRHHVECLADVLLLVAGSDELMEAVHEDVDQMENNAVRTRLGWFKDRRGVVRWGIEVVGAEGVEWLDAPEKEKEEEMDLRA